MEFVRECECLHCGRKYVVSGWAANPSNETQFAMEFPCACGALAIAHMPGSVNRDRMKIEPIPIGAKA